MGNDTKKALGLASSALLRTLVVTLVMAMTQVLAISSLQAQNFNTVVPMDDWVEYKQVTYKAEPVELHLRTGYERVVVFPEPITLYSMNNQLITDAVPELFPGCLVVLNAEVLGFSPRQRFSPQTLSVRGTQSGFVYELLVSSSPVGSRQPIEINRK